VSVNLSKDEANFMQRIKLRHRAQPHRSYPGNHDVYFLSLDKLTKIIIAHAALFTPWMPDIQQWIVRISSVAIPRNIVGHMNWLNAIDEQDIDALYTDLRRLYRQLPATGLTLLIP
jgi:hypothetical protein